MTTNKPTNNEGEAIPSPMTASTPSSPLKGRLIILAIVAIGVLPLLAALYFRYVSPPEVKATVGEPIAPCRCRSSSCSASMAWRWSTLQSAASGC